MACSKAVKDILRSVLAKLHEVFVEDRLDDTEYIRNVRAVLEGAEMFLQDSGGLVGEPEKVKQELYAFSKSLWLENLERIRKRDAVSEEGSGSRHDEYYRYYYDYIYNHGTYPH